MDKIWDGKPFKMEVIDQCGGHEQTEWSHRTDTVEH